jgi:hypothetical protein
MKEDIKKVITESPAEPENKVVKALLIGFVAGALIGLSGEDLSFNLYGSGLDYYGWGQAIFTWVVVSGALYLKYNSKKD